MTLASQSKCALVTVILATGLQAWRYASGECAVANLWQQELLSRLDEPWRSRALEIARSPQVQLRGVAESFPCRREVYRWLLDHPDWGYRLWEELGARGARVYGNADGSFVGEDEQGNRLHWWTIHRQSGLHLWYVEATGRTNLLQQPARVRALLLLQYQPVQAPSGQTGIRHATELVAQLDARGWRLILHLGQNAAQDYARQCLEQVQLFFAGLAWYVSEHPNWAKQCLRQLLRAHPGEAGTGQELLQLLNATSAE